MNFAKAYKFVPYLIGLPIFIWLIYDYGLDNIWENLRKTSYWIIPVIFTWFVVYFFNTLSWRYIIKSGGKHVKFPRLFGLTVSGFAMNYVTPFVNLGGEPYRILALKEDMSGTSATSFVILYTMMHMFSHIWFWIAGFIIMLWSLALSGTDLMIAVISLAVIIPISFLFNRMFKKGFLCSVYRGVKKIPLLRKIANKYSDKEELLIDLDKKVSNFYNKDPKSFYKSLITEVMSRVISSLEFLFILKAIGINITFFEAVYINAAYSLITNITFMIPMQLGTREGSLFLVFQTMGILPGFGVFASLVTRLREFFWISLGLIFIPLNGRKLRVNGQMKNEIRKEMEKENAD